MNRELMGLSVREFGDLLASDAPAPGGGSVAALNLALGAALVEMVCALTIGRKKYAEVEAEMLELQQKASALHEEANHLVQNDTAAYQMVMAAYALPRESDDDKKARREAILQATRGAIQVPLQTAQQSLKLCELAVQALRQGNSNAASDALVASYQGYAAGLSALANVRINLDGLNDDAEISEYEAEIERIQATLDKALEQAALMAKVRLG